MAQNFVTKKFQFKVEYPPTLQVFSRMESVAVKLASEFPDWERTANWIELRNWERHQVLRIGFKDTYFYCDDPPVLADEIQLSLRCLDLITKRCDISKPLKVFSGIQMLSEYDGTLEELVALMHRKFHVQLSTIPGFGEADVVDLAYQIDFKDRGSADWYRKLLVGPMNRKEWLVKNPLTIRMGDLAGELMDRRKVSIPPVFVFVALDGIYDNLPSRQVADAIHKLMDASLPLANSLFSYCKA